MTEEKRLICPQCGHDNPYDFLICGQCGADLLIESVTTDSLVGDMATLPGVAHTKEVPTEVNVKAPKLSTESDDLAQIQDQIRKSATPSFSQWLSTSFYWQFNLGTLAIIAWVVFLLVVGVKYFINRMDDVPLGSGRVISQNRNHAGDTSGTSGSAEEVEKKFELPAGAIKAVVQQVKSAEVIQVFDPEKETTADIRLIGISAPEAYPNGTQEQGSLEAYQYLQDRIKGREVGLVYGMTRSETGVPWRPRSFAYVYFEGDMLNLVMLSQGLVILGDPAPENSKIAEDFKLAQSIAKREKVGLWVE